MKKNKNKLIAKGLTALIFIGIGFLVGWRGMPHYQTRVISQTTYQEPTNVIKVQLEDGWECEKPKMDTDLLQPSGYWIGSTIDCWKLETPIEEFLVEQCVETKDNYWCDQIK